jgi:hypothetical protein
MNDETIATLDVAELAFALAGEPEDVALEAYLRIKHSARVVLDRLSPELNEYERDAAANRFLDEVQKSAIALQARCPSVISTAIH